MAVELATGAIVAKPGQAIALSSIVSTTPSSDNPAYVVVSGLDRNEYTITSNGNTGVFSGNGHSAGFVNLGGDANGVGIVFTYNSTTGRYTNSTFGNLDNVVLTASTDTNRNEAISVFTSNDSYLLSQFASNTNSLMGMSHYVGTVSVVTQPAANPAPVQATPNSIASVAVSFVGQAWNNAGCWVLANNICAEAGASLPVTTSSIGVSGVANGEWIVTYNGPAGQTGDWQGSLRAGDLVVYATPTTAGHITTVVSGTGVNALVVDNAVVTNASGTVLNSANDGSSKDIVITSPHSANADFSKALPGSVVIYRLDTPVVSVASSLPVFAAQGSSLSLSSLLTASDSGTRAVTQYQIYDTATGAASADILSVSGVSQSAHSAASAFTVSASGLSQVVLRANGASGTDTLQVRASNGAYWGDWQSISVNLGSAPAQAPVATVTPTPVTPSAPTSVSPVTPVPVAAPEPIHVAAAPQLQAPIVFARTGNMVWNNRWGIDGTSVAPAFRDPQALGMTYQAYQVSGPALSQLHFDPIAGTFSGSTRGVRGTVEMAIVATNSAGLSTTETFNITLVQNARRFAQAMAAVQGGYGAAGAVAGAADHNTLHALFAPVAR